METCSPVVQFSSPSRFLVLSLPFLPPALTLALPLYLLFLCLHVPTPPQPPRKRQSSRHSPSPIQTILIRPTHKRLLPIQQHNLHPPLLFQQPIQPLLPHPLPPPLQRPLHGSRRMQNHRARRRAIRRPNKPLRHHLAIIMRHQRQSLHVSLLCPRRVARRDQVDEGHRCAVRGGRHAAAVVECEGP